MTCQPCLIAQRDPFRRSPCTSRAKHLARLLVEGEAMTTMVCTITRDAPSAWPAEGGAPTIRALTPDRARDRAKAIHNALASGRQIQVRWHRGWLLTYPYPAPRGYGTRGEMVGIYAAGAHVEWIEADLLAFAKEHDV